MGRRFVRIENISIENFKNVQNGSLNLKNRRKNYRASILGLYGQNGSGKTALIDAMDLLKHILCGKVIPARMADYIHVDAEYAALFYQFRVTDMEGCYEVFYECKIRREAEMAEENVDLPETQDPKPRVTLFDEVLSYSYESKHEKIRKGPFIDTRTERVFVPVSKYESLFGKEKETEMRLMVAKKIAEQTSRSFVFSRELLNETRKQSLSRDVEVHPKQDLEFMRHQKLLERLIFYGNYELFVIRTANTGMISMDALPLIFQYRDNQRRTVGKLMIPLEKPAVVPQEQVEIVEKVLQDMNLVLKQIVPGLTIGVRELGTQVLEQGGLGVRIQLVSHKNSKEIPLRDESEGIKKIISVLHLLIVIYNQSSITVAIDELDSGVFEYLLGEILRIISEKGKGQLLFTSHNLRPLETLDRGFIAFTTTNPENRYIRLMNVKDTHNLRDFYFRDIVLGEQKENVYEPTNNAEIALAFREAGEGSGS